MDFITQADDYISRYISEKNLKIICLLSVAVLSGIWALLTFDKTAVPSEGWYAVYADMIAAGMVPYRDFDLLFPPLYTYLMTFVSMLGGGNILAYRVLGVLVFISLGIVIYLVLRFIAPPWISAVGAVAAVFVMQSEIVFLSYDYIRIYDLFNYLALFLLLRTLVRSYRKESPADDRSLFWVGLMVALALLTRQSTGMIVMVVFIIVLFILYFLVRDVGLTKKNIGFFFIGLAIPLAVTAVWLFSIGSFDSFIQMTLMSGSKGDFMTMLFNWIPRLFTENPMRIIMSLLVAAGIIFASKKFLPMRDSESDPFERMLYLVFITVSGVLVVSLFISLGFSYDISAHWVSYVKPMFIINLVLMFVLAFYAIRCIYRKESIPSENLCCLLICMFIFCVGFGTGTSADLSLGESALNYGIVIALVLALVRRVPARKMKLCIETLTLCFVVLLVATSVSVKVVLPYQWWGLGEDPYEDAVYETDIPYFGGIKMSADEKELYEDFVAWSHAELGAGDELYCYSQVPIFYKLAGVLPTVKAPVSWFDVSRESTIAEDLDYLKANNPKMMMFADHGYYVLEEHERMFGTLGESTHRAMYEWMLDCMKAPDSEYTVVESHVVGGYPYHILVHN
jgi:hypothetical protein